MKRLLQWIRHMAGAVLLLALLLIALLVYLGTTQHGLQTTGRLLAGQLDDTLQFGELQGTLLSVIEVDDLKLQVGPDRYHLGHVQLDWSPRTLLLGEVRINRLMADSIEVALGKREPQDDAAFSLDITLPVKISVRTSSLTALSITSGDDEPVQFDQITLAARAAGEQLDIDRFTLAAENYSAGLSGVLGLAPTKNSDLRMDWDVTLEALTTTGRANLSGLLDAYALNGEAHVSGPQIPAGQWRIKAEGTQAGLALHDLQGDTLAGTVAGTGRLDWTEGFSWQADVDAQQLDPGGHWPDWPGALSAQLVTNGAVQAGQWHTLLQLDKLQGQLRGYPVSGQVDVLLREAALTINTLALTSANNQLSASGKLDEQWNITANADIADMAAVLPGWAGQLSLAGTLTGARERPVINATLDATGLAGAGLSVDTVAAQAVIDWHETAEQSVSASIAGLELAGQAYESATLDFSGSLQAHRLLLAATGEEADVDLALAGNFSDPLWRGTLEKADWQYPGAGEWRLQQPVALELGTTHIALPETCWVQEDARLCADAAGEFAAGLETGVRLESFPLSALRALEKAPVTLGSRIDADMRAALQAGQLKAADLQVRLGAGSVTYTDPTLPSDMRLGGGVLQATLNEAGLDARAELELTGADYLDASLSLPGYQAGITPWEKQSLDLNVAGELQDMLFIKYLLEEVGRYEGKLQIDLHGEGTLAQPRLSGGANISDATLGIDRLGINLSGLDVQLRSRDNGLSVTGRCDSGDGSVTLVGDITIADIAHWQADVHLQGSDFEVMHLPEGVILVSPDIKARLTPPDLLLTGEVHVPYARLRPRDISTRTGVSRDVIIVREDEPAVAAERWRVTSDIRLSLGDDVSIDGFGLTGDILGAVNLQDVPGKATTARGRLSIERGTYEAYGRALEINRGQLLFSGGPVDNPGLDFEASRRIGAITAGLRASGTLREPELTLYSDPTMPDGDIISYIAFGKPQSQIGQGGGSMTDAGLLAGGNMLAGRLGTRLGLEELGVESGETLEDAAMVLGTYLSPQIYVRYRTGLYDAINEFEVRFELSRRWSIRTITSVEASSAEIQFSFER
jgi:translocation and assembly module TamB